MFMSGIAAVSVFAAAPEYEVFDYGDVTKDVSDISFYENTPPLDGLSLNTEAGDERDIRNVVLMIGDGMGFGHIQLARAAVKGAGARLYTEQMPVTGVMRTHSARAYVTDSAASGTAMACGIKTDNKRIGMDNLGKSYHSILELAEEDGKRSGLVTTARISHATPAVFAAHVESRKNEDEIAVQILSRDIEVLLGGGRRHWEAGERADGRDLLAEARAKGYALADTGEEFRELKGEKILGLFQDGHLTTFPPEPTIADMTRKALATLDRDEDKGFFLMVEGARIDHAGHANNADNAVKQTLLFDLAVRAALDFARRDGHTLVVATADHETGGLIVSGGGLTDRPEANWSTRGHSAMDVPVYAYGPGAIGFTGVMDNTELAAKLAATLGIGDCPQKIDGASRPTAGRRSRFRTPQSASIRDAPPPPSP